MASADSASVGSSKAGKPRPTLPKSLFAALANDQATDAKQRRRYPRDILDTHIHLWTQTQLDRGQIKWPLDSAPEQLRAAHTLKHFARLTADALASDANWGPMTGAVFVQGKSHPEVEHDDSELDGSNGGWDAALNEIVESAHSFEMLSAPVHQGPMSLAAYFELMSTLPPVKASFENVTSCRFLLQDCPRGFMLHERFVDGLLWLGQHNVAFEMTLDVVKVPGVLDDATDTISRLRQLEEERQAGNDGHKLRTRIVLDHFAKPNLLLEPLNPPAPHQSAYIQSLFELSLLPDVYLKLSGLLDCAPPDLVKDAFDNFRNKRQTQKNNAFSELRRRILTYVEPALEAFGDTRIFVGSDWPMFRAKTCFQQRQRAPPEEAAAWIFEMELYRSALVEIGCDGVGLDRIFCLNAKNFYRIS
ncbi:hypothetical protein OIV83_001085 [Microbotryomycetes sp. JL201]|nr:hypothetical protein OIV83_001085 [Microbotryomycetes sp. JL201]